MDKPDTGNKGCTGHRMKTETIPPKKNQHAHTHNTTKTMNNLAPTIKLEETRVFVKGKIQTFSYLLYCIILILKEQKFSIVRHMCDVKVFLTFTFTEYGTVLTTILPILFLYLNTVIVTAGDFEP
jgi:hypothetical protein